MTTDQIGSDWCTTQMTLTPEECEERLELARATYEDQSLADEELRAFKEFAGPRIDSALDPLFDPDSVAFEPLSAVEARALADELDRRKAVRGAKISLLKANRRRHLDAAANGYEYVVVVASLQLDASGTQVAYVHPETGEVLRMRPATAAERQLALPCMDDDDDDDDRGGSGAPGVAL